jgi:hypothetical protein
MGVAVGVAVGVGVGKITGVTVAEADISNGETPGFLALISPRFVQAIVIAMSTNIIVVVIFLLSND